LRADRPADHGAPAARGRIPGPAAIELPSATYRLIGLFTSFIARLF
jgi:hypothetical protein